MKTGTKLGIAALGVAAYVKGTGALGAIPPAFAIVIGLFLPFTIAISPQEVEAAKVIRVGDTIPHFTALDDQSATFDSAIHSVPPRDPSSRLRTPSGCGRVVIPHRA